MTHLPRQVSHRIDLSVMASSQTTFLQSYKIYKSLFFSTDFLEPPAPQMSVEYEI